MTDTEKVIVRGMLECADGEFVSLKDVTPERCVEFRETLRAELKDVLAGLGRPYRRARDAQQKGQGCRARRGTAHASAQQGRWGGQAGWGRAMTTMLS